MRALQTIRNMARKVIGYNEIEESFKSLFYYLNQLHNPADFPPASGDLRLLQIADTMLLRIFDLVCQKEDLEYWLDWGTLLGAVRHKGFIPWDDDTDVSMDRESYLRAVKILPRIFAEYGIDAEEEPNQYGRRIGIGYKHLNTGIWIDVFPVDYSNVDLKKAMEKDQLEKEMNLYRKKYHNKLCLIKDGEEQVKERMKIIHSLCDKEKSKSIISCVEVDSKNYIFSCDSIFPLTRAKFEGFEMSIPKDPDTYLKTAYGDYSLFPATGILHHDEGRGALSTWAKRSGVNMNDIIKELEEIYNRIDQKYSK